MLSLRKYRDRLEVQHGYKLFSDNVRSVYTLEENEYLESIVKNGLYDGVDELIKAAGEDREMYEKLMELFKDELTKQSLFYYCL